MLILISAKTRQGQSSGHDQLAGWPEGQTGPLTAPLEITLITGTPPAECLRLALDPVTVAGVTNAAGGAVHYFRWADGTLRPLPAKAGLSFARGDAYIAVSPGALRLADSPAMARYLHLHDGFNAERLAEGLLGFLAQEFGQPNFPEDVTVLVVEAR